MAVPALILTAASALYQGYRAKKADQYNAAVMANERTASMDQAAQAEALQRRAGREAFGRQSAAFGSAGVGYGGSSATALKQSAINEELDALTTRYRGAFTGYGYGVESSLLKQEAGEEQTSSFLLAGSRALSMLPGSYTRTPTGSPAAGSGGGGRSGVYSLGG
jgi:hypothetical protein